MIRTVGVEGLLLPRPWSLAPAFGFAAPFLMAIGVTLLPRALAFAPARASGTAFAVTFAFGAMATERTYAYTQEL